MDTTRPRRFWRLALLGLVAGVLFVMFLLLGGGGAAACAYVDPSAPRYIPPLKTLLVTLAINLGPGILTFIAFAYIALGSRRLWLRWVLLGCAAVLALSVVYLEMIFTFHCSWPF